MIQHTLHCHTYGEIPKYLPIFLHKHAPQVTSNLENALRRLQGPTKPTVIWIDTLCINQEDDVEKGSQVAVMGDMYEKSMLCFS